MRLISFIIPTYDNYAQLGDCVQSIKDNVTGNYEIIIVDNGSQARGHTVPANQGILAAKGDYLCLLNDDVIIDDPSWRELLEPYMELDEWFFSPTEINHLGTEEVTMKIAGCCMFISRRAYTVLGLLDERFRIWCGDIDYIKRAEARGHGPVRVDGVHIHHTTSMTTSRPELAGMISQWQMEDLDRYRAKWQSDPNEDKVRHEEA